MVMALACSLPGRGSGFGGGVGVGVVFIGRCIDCAKVNVVGLRREGLCTGLGEGEKWVVSLVWVRRQRWRILGVQELALVQVLLSIKCYITERRGCLRWAAAVIVSWEGLDWV